MYRCTLMLGCLAVLGVLGCEPSSSGPEVSHGPAYLPEGAVLPTSETIESGEYKPLSRPLYLYVNKASLKRPEVVAFLEYYLSDEGQILVEDSGYIKLSPQTYKEQQDLLKAAIQEVGGVEQPKEITGQVMVDGSSTVAPISTAVAEEFSKMHSEVRVPVGTSGTGGGFKKFYAGESDICDASRPISESEIERCKEAGIDYLPLKVAIDGLTVVVNPQNTWVDGLTVEELRKLWNPDSKIQKWSELNPDFPDVQIKLFGPDTDSGTFDYFTEAICGGDGASRSDYQQSADDNFLVTGVVGDQYALAYFGYAYYVENQDKLKALAIAP